MLLKVAALHLPYAPVVVTSWNVPATDCLRSRYTRGLAVPDPDENGIRRDVQRGAYYCVFLMSGRTRWVIGALSDFGSGEAGIRANKSDY